MAQNEIIKLDSEKIRGLLNEIGTELARRGEVAEIALYGGAALLLMFGDRPMTKDVDFDLMEGHLDELLEVAEEVGRRHHLPDNWFNDAVQVFLNDHEELVSYGDFPIVGEVGLRVFTATPEYLLSMKLLAMRNALESHDIEDVWRLAEACAVDSAEQARGIFSRHFPGEILSERNANLLEDIIADRAAGRPYSPMNYW